MTRAIPHSAVSHVVRARAAVRPTTSTRSIGRSAGLAVAAASAGAGLIHLALGPAHVEGLGPLGFGFFLAAGLQLGWASLAVAVVVGFAGQSRVRPLASLAISGIAINATVLAAWAVSRIAGLPTGDVTWTPEALGIPDAVSGLFEGALVLGLVAWLRGWQSPLPIRSRATTFAAAALAMALISAGTVAAIQPSEAAHAHGADHAPSTGDAHGAAEPAYDAEPARDPAGEPEAAEAHPAH